MRNLPLAILSFLVLALLAWGAGVSQTPAAPETGRPAHWTLQYFYDEDDSELKIRDLEFASPRRGVAVGILSEKSREKAVALVTSDAGNNWSTVPLKELPLSLFLLDESTGWLVTDRGVWKTEESGYSWKKISKQSELLRVHFLDAARGWAVGLKKSVFETRDGGKTWEPLAAAKEPQSNKDFSVYSTIDFADSRRGIIAGWHKAPRRGSRFPAWMDPSQATRREQPSLTLLLQTTDGGETWKSSMASTFGRVAQVSLAPDGGLALFEYRDQFQWPSEVYRLEINGGGSKSVYRDRNRVITDVMLLPGGLAFLAGHETMGTVKHTPIPGKLKIITSTGMEKWEEMEVDYRAVANRVVFAASGPDDIWVATDTGMILKLVR